MAFSDFQQLVDDMVRDSTTADAASRDRAIEQARLRYSADALRTLVVDVTWPEAGYSAPAPAGWDEESWVKTAEYPIGKQPIAEIEMGVMATPGEGGAVTWSLASYVHLPADAKVRLTWTASHELRAAAGEVPGADTIPLKHRLPVASYAAHLLCQQLAAHYSGQRETAIGADSSSTETRAREYAARAKEYRAGYYVGIGLADPFKTGGAAAGAASGGQAAFAIGSWPGRPRHSLTRGVQ